jgi:SAM-dependent methyltransferase
VRAEDLEALTLASGSVDLVVTQDVFEHVLRPDVAFAEIARVLVPGGAHVFSVPLFPHPATVVRAIPAPDGGVVHLLEPDYHKDPVNPSGALVVREWSADIADYILRHSGLATTIHNLRDRRRGIDGDHRDILVSRKPA